MEGMGQRDAGGSCLFYELALEITCHHFYYIVFIRREVHIWHTVKGRRIRLHLLKEKVSKTATYLKMPMVSKKTGSYFKHILEVRKRRKQEGKDVVEDIHTKETF